MMSTGDDWKKSGQEMIHCKIFPPALGYGTLNTFTYGCCVPFLSDWCHTVVSVLYSLIMYIYIYIYLFH